MTAQKKNPFTYTALENPLPSKLTAEAKSISHS
jgi:hypothetical protein